MAFFVFSGGFACGPLIELDLDLRFPSLPGNLGQIKSRDPPETATLRHPTGIGAPEIRNIISGEPTRCKDTQMASERILGHASNRLLGTLLDFP